VTVVRAAYGYLAHRLMLLRLTKLLCDAGCCAARVDEMAWWLPTQLRTALILVWWCLEPLWWHTVSCHLPMWQKRSLAADVPGTFGCYRSTGTRSSLEYRTFPAPHCTLFFVGAAVGGGCGDGDADGEWWCRHCLCCCW
jgi:hypothetical protein